MSTVSTKHSVIVIMCQKLSGKVVCSVDVQAEQNYCNSTLGHRPACTPVSVTEDHGWELVQYSTKYERDFVELTKSCRLHTRCSIDGVAKQTVPRHLHAEQSCDHGACDDTPTNHSDTDTLHRTTSHDVTPHLTAVIRLLRVAHFTPIQICRQFSYE